MMILAMFPASPKDMVMYAEISKPNYFDVLKTALEEWYSNSVAENYVESLAESLFDEMDFPEDGIYYVNSQTNTLFYFLKKTRKWTDTKKSFEDYIVDPSNNIWDKIFSRYPHLKKAGESIKSQIKEQTEKMFNVTEWRNVCSFDLETNSVLNHDQLSQSLLFLREYFSEKKAGDIYNDIMKLLFSTSSNNTIVILNNGILVGMLSNKGFKKVDESNYSKLNKYFSELMSKEEMPAFMERLKNLLIWGLPYTSIINSEQGQVFCMERNGLNIFTHDRVHFYAKKIPSEIFYGFIEKCYATTSRSCEEYYGSRHTYYLTINIRSPDEIISEEYGIKIPVHHLTDSLYVKADNEHIYQFACGRSIGEFEEDKATVVRSKEVDQAKNIEVILI